jgi:hypothetical protein
MVVETERTKCKNVHHAVGILKLKMDFRHTFNHNCTETDFYFQIYIRFALSTISVSVFIWNHVVRINQRRSYCLKPCNILYGCHLEICFKTFRQMTDKILLISISMINHHIKLFLSIKYHKFVCISLKSMYILL